MEHEGGCSDLLNNLYFGLDFRRSLPPPAGPAVYGQCGHTQKSGQERHALEEKAGRGLKILMSWNHLPLELTVDSGSGRTGPGRIPLLRRPCLQPKWALCDFMLGAQGKAPGPGAPGGSRGSQPQQTCVTSGGFPAAEAQQEPSAAFSRHKEKITEHRMY